MAAAAALHGFVPGRGGSAPKNVALGVRIARGKLKLAAPCWKRVDALLTSGHGVGRISANDLLTSMLTPLDPAVLEEAPQNDALSNGIKAMLAQCARSVETCLARRKTDREAFEKITKERDDFKARLKQLEALKPTKALRPLQNAATLASQDAIPANADAPVSERTAASRAIRAKPIELAATIVRVRALDKGIRALCDTAGEDYMTIMAQWTRHCGTDIIMEGAAKGSDGKDYLSFVDFAVQSEEGGKVKDKFIAKWVAESRPSLRDQIKAQDKALLSNGRKRGFMKDLPIVREILGPQHLVDRERQEVDKEIKGQLKLRETTHKGVAVDPKSTLEASLSALPEGSVPDDLELKHTADGRVIGAVSDCLSSVTPTNIAQISPQSCHSVMPMAAAEGKQRTGKKAYRNKTEDPEKHSNLRANFCEQHPKFPPKNFDFSDCHPPAPHPLPPLQWRV